MLGFEVGWGPRLVNVSMGRGRSAIDGTAFSSVDLAVLVPVARRLDIEFNVGRGNSELQQSGLYGGVLFLVYGGG